MADLAFRITGVAPASNGLTPLLHFNLQIVNEPAGETVQAVLLHTQIQIESPKREYSPREKERLNDLFGTPDRWGQTLRNQLWTIVHVTVPAFTGSIELPLSVPCTYDLNMKAAKYFYALDDGAAALLFLFSGTIFHEDAGRRLQVRQISWERECTFRMPVQTWRELMEHHYPNCAWLYLQRDIFDRLYAYRLRHGFGNWEQTVENLLLAGDAREVSAG